MNTDAHKIITRGEPANFFVYYPVDDDTSKHNLTLDGYGADDHWVLLEPAPEGCTRIALFSEWTRFSKHFADSRNSRFWARAHGNSDRTRGVGRSPARKF